MEIKDRIKSVMDRENLSSGDFAKSIGLQQSTLSHVLNGRNNPSLDVVMKVNQRYPYANLEWLLYGTGEMAQGQTTQPPTPTTVKSGFTSSLFDQNPEKEAVIPADPPVVPKYRREMPSEMPQNTPKETVVQEVKYIEKPPRKITEIRIFFDDNTYEIFKPDK